jgi:hypothetical protein
MHVMLQVYGDVSGQDKLRNWQFAAMCVVGAVIGVS